MIDRKEIMKAAEKLLDIMSHSGYICGKIEIDYDMRTKSRKLQVHRFDRKNETIIRTTDVIDV